jgi:type II secretory pathway component GspD/PulD (secretin)
MVNLDNHILKVLYQIHLPQLKKIKMILTNLLLIVTEPHQMQEIIKILNSSVKMKAQIKILILILIKRKAKFDKLIEMAKKL